ATTSLHESSSEPPTLPLEIEPSCSIQNHRLSIRKRTVQPTCRCLRALNRLGWNRSFSVFVSSWLRSVYSGARLFMTVWRKVSLVPVAMTATVGSSSETVSEPLWKCGEWVRARRHSSALFTLADQPTLPVALLRSGQC